MRRVRFIRFVPSLLALGVLGAALAGQPSASVSAPAPSVTAGTRAMSSWVPPSPTNAGKIFRWGNKQWGDEFKTALSSTWRVSSRAMVRNQHGMLTLDAPAGRSVDVQAVMTGHNRQYGRWEARVRSRQYGTTGTPYTLHWELAPQTGGAHCGAHDLVLATYRLGTNTATMHLRRLPDRDYTASVNTPLSDNEFHTYAVEVTPDHVSWFVDTKVVRTERRSEALAPESYAMRFRLEGQPGAQMRRGRMQMDWARFYTLARKNAQPITAPQLTQTTYAGAC